MVRGGKIYEIQMGKRKVVCNAYDTAIYNCYLWEYTAHAKGKQLKVTKSKSTLYVLDTKNNASQIKVKYGKKNVTKACKYSITNKKIATVNKVGKVTAVKTGTATIKIKYKEKKKNIKIVVKNSTLSLNKNDENLNVGESDILKMYANKNTIANKNIKWTTSDRKIATVSKEGRIKAIKEGTVIITGTTKIGQKTCKVVVKKTECKHKWDTRITFPEGVEKRPAILCACGKVFFEQDTWEVHFF